MAEWMPPQEGRWLVWASLLAVTVLASSWPSEDGGSRESFEQLRESELGVLGHMESDDIAPPKIVFPTMRRDAVDDGHRTTIRR